MRWVSTAIWERFYPLIASLIFGLIEFLPVSGSIKRWKSERELSVKMRPAPSSGRYYYLVFCPSLGEYEAIKMLLFDLRKKRPNAFIEIIFFSPSGYNALISKSDHNADAISFAPIDTKLAVKSFFEFRQVDEVFISTLALWPIFLGHLISAQIPYSFVGVHIKLGRLKRIYYSSLSRYIEKAKFLFIIDKMSFQFLANISSNVMLVGDLRIKGIQSDLKISPPMLKSIHSFKENSRLLVLGSTHEKDEQILFPLLTELTSDNWKIIIAPHEINRSHLLLDKIENAILYSKFYQHIDEKIMIINELRLLKHLYKWADVSYVGGGFSNAIHNILEPLLAGSVLIIGPRHSNSYLAPILVDASIIKVINNKNEFEKALIVLSQKQYAENTVQKFEKIILQYSDSNNLIINSLS